MDQREEAILAVADITLEAEAITRAALDRDFDEARFRAMLVAEKAKIAGLTRVAAAATHALQRLGPPGTIPHSGHGEAIFRLASAIDTPWLDQR